MLYLYSYPINSREFTVRRIVAHRLWSVFLRNPSYSATFIEFSVVSLRFLLYPSAFLVHPSLYIQPTRGYKEMEGTPRAARSLRNTLKLKTLPSPSNTQKLIEIRVHCMGTVNDTVRWSKVQNDCDSGFRKNTCGKKKISFCSQRGRMPLCSIGWTY